MNVESEIRTLRGEVQQAFSVLERLERYLCDFEASRLIDKEPGTEEAMVVAQSLSNYYTCLETAFLRISRYFENNLSSQNWHRDLLEKMTLEIEEIRPRIISAETHHDLLELLKFRHFTRYYFELDYDWDKLRFLLKKFHDVRPRVKTELRQFDAFLFGLLNAS